MELCLKEERVADAIILAQAGGSDLLKQAQERYLAEKKTGIAPVTDHHAERRRRGLLGPCQEAVCTTGLAFRGFASLSSYFNHPYLTPSP